MSLALYHVGAVHAGRGDLHQDFALARRRHRLLFGNEHVRSAWFADGNAGHRFGQTAVRHKCSFSIGDRINPPTYDVTTGIGAV